MTTLAIIGGGIMGRSLLYTLAKEENSFSKICLFSSDTITFPCTLHSTAVAAPRGITRGHSPLGDELVEGLEVFCRHVEVDGPRGVDRISQYTVSTQNVELFRKRYPDGEFSRLYLKESSYQATEEAYMIDPPSYLGWLTEKAQALLGDRVMFVEDLVTEVKSGDQVGLHTLGGREFQFDRVIFACGSYNRFWKNEVPDSRLKTSRPVQGSYLEFSGLDWSHPSFSLTVDGDNIVWNARLNRLYVGSTSQECSHELAPREDLEAIYERLRLLTSLDLPAWKTGQVRVGMREKAQKREPYTVVKGPMTFVGGLYKNAFTLAMKISQDLSRGLSRDGNRSP